MTDVEENGHTRENEGLLRLQQETREHSPQEYYVLLFNNVSAVFAASPSGAKVGGGIFRNVG